MIVDLQLETHHQPPIIEFVPIDVIDTASQVRKTFDQDELL